MSRAETKKPATSAGFLKLVHCHRNRIERVILVAEEDGRPAVAALGHVMRQPAEDGAGEAAMSRAYPAALRPSIKCTVTVIGNWSIKCTVTVIRLLR